MPMISVKSKPGVIVPREVGGKPISTTMFEAVPDTRWIRNRIADGDLEVKVETSASTPDQKAAPAKASAN